MCALLLALLLLVANDCPGPNCRLAPPRALVGRLDKPSYETVRTANFVVHAHDSALAQRVAGWAEAARTELMKRWYVPVPAPVPVPDLGCAVKSGTGTGTSPWPRPVTITVHRDHPGYFATEFGDDGVVSITLWAGDVHLESTVRHEVCHAVLHLRYPTQILPRWFDEGLAVCQESPVEKQRQLAPLFHAPQRFSVRQLCGLTEYPREAPLFYAQSYSLVDFLVRRHGEHQLLRFLEASFRIGQENALRQELGYASFEDLDRQWWAEVGKKR